MDKNTVNYELGSKSKQFLREQAELIVREKMTLSPRHLEMMSPEALRELAHELQVHQIELEMQNEALRQTQLQLELMRERYFDLYDLAPVSYCTVNEMGVILEVNLATAELLGQTRNSLIGQRISRYIHKEFQDTYYLCRKLLMTRDEPQNCELRMNKASGLNDSNGLIGINGINDTSFWAHVTLAAARDSNGGMVQRMVLTDITNAKIMAMAMQESESRLRSLVESHH